MKSTENVKIIKKIRTLRLIYFNYFLQLIYLLMFVYFSYVGRDELESKQKVLAFAFGILYLVMLMGLGLDVSRKVKYDGMGPFLKKRLFQSLIGHIPCIILILYFTFFS